MKKSLLITLAIWTICATASPMLLYAEEQFGDPDSGGITQSEEPEGAPTHKDAEPPEEPRQPSSVEPSESTQYDRQTQQQSIKRGKGRRFKHQRRRHFKGQRSSARSANNHDVDAMVKRNREKLEQVKRRMGISEDGRITKSSPDEDYHRQKKVVPQADQRPSEPNLDKDDELYKASKSIFVPANTYTSTSQYDDLKPYDAFTRGKQACEKGDPQGYALLESSARRGCNHAKILLAHSLLPAEHKLAQGCGSFILEGKEWSEKDRLERYIKWMSSAADNGSLAACKELRQLYKEGTYVAKDSAKVFHYTKAAAQLKDPDAMFDLGERYAKGVGCKKDRAAAVKWMKQAAHAGNDEAKQWIEDRRGHMVDVQVAAGTKRNNLETIFNSDTDPKGGHYFYGAGRGLTVDEFCRYFRSANLYIICGIVHNTFSHNGMNYAVLRYGRDAILVMDRTNRLISHKGDAVRIRCLYNPNLQEEYRIIATELHAYFCETETIYKTVQKWKGPKIGGWEDLLK